MSEVALVKGNDRKENIIKSLNLIKDDIKKSLKNKQIVIKPNFVSNSVQLAATHVDHVRGILDFFKNFYKKKIIIGEAAYLNTKAAFRNFGYYSLLDEYNVELRDLNDDEYEIFELPNFRGGELKKVNRTLPGPNQIRIAKTFLNKNNYLISAAKLKTHDAVVATLSLKNIVMGSIINDERSMDKSKMHQGIKEINYFIFLLAKKLRLVPDLAVIDGFRGMEGDGPTHGTPIDTKVAISSTDFLAADRVALEIMGIPPDKVGYLTYCAENNLGEYNLEKIIVTGEKLENCKKKFKLHSNVEEQFKWR